MIQGFVIKDTKTDLYSKGGISPIWKSSPKIWSNLAHIKTHLNQFVFIDYKTKTIHIRNTYKDCVVCNINGDVQDFDIMKYIMCIAVREKNKLNYNEYTIVED